MLLAVSPPPLQHPDREFIIRVSYLEIYKESLIDLLHPDNKELRIREDPQVGTDTLYIHMCSGHTGWVWVQHALSTLIYGYSALHMLKSGVMLSVVSICLSINK